MGLRKISTKLNRYGQGIAEYAIVLALVVIASLMVINFIDVEKNLDAIFQAINGFLSTVTSYIGS